VCGFGLVIVVHSVIQHKDNPDVPESGASTTTERNESCALIEGENHRETPQHSDIPVSCDQNICLAWILSKECRTM